MLKNRTFIGILAITAGIIICFVISPLFTKAMEEKIDIVTLKSPVKQGEMLTEAHISVVKMGAYNMPPSVLKNPKDVVGKYAKSNLYRGSVVIKDMLSDEADNSDSRLVTLPENKFAMSITIRSLAEGLSGKLLPGDIIRIVSVGEDKTAAIYDELLYVEVLTTTTKDGVHAEGDTPREGGDEMDLPVTMTLILQDDLQALRLAECEKTNLHAVFVTRDPDKIVEFLAEQADILAAIHEENDESETSVSVFEPNHSSNATANTDELIPEREEERNE